ncbi:hypothetical protein GUJ93_ZPchr0006g40979 [Zizania palustris]|uniref:Uncharacterized protein n=1 Tax=Zizania palustris TaxID=103762 RepID=A0A8J5SAI7_ZIZPA|nr:hypothetical protein GUJ93_ZPchr0006g40979 [Zizania palustris]
MLLHKCYTEFSCSGVWSFRLYIVDCQIYYMGTILYWWIIRMTTEPIAHLDALHVIHITCRILYACMLNKIFTSSTSVPGTDGQIVYIFHERGRTKQGLT